MATRVLRRSVHRAVLHDTEDGPIHLLVAEDKNGWLARIWGDQLAGARHFKTIGKANQWVAKSFGEMFPEHTCNAGCAAVDEVALQTPADCWRSASPKSLPVSRIHAAFSTLTARELEVFRFVVQGVDNKQIAHRLGMSIPTVRSHRHHLMHKFGIRSTAQLVRFAVRIGLIELQGVTCRGTGPD